MKARYVVLLAVLMVLIGSNNLFASDRFGMGFSYFNSQHDFSGGLGGDIPLKEVSGRVNLNKGFNLVASHSFGDNRGYMNSDLKDTQLSLTRNFIDKERTKLSLGAGIKHSLFSTKVFGQGIFDIQEGGVSAVAEFEQGLTDKISIFTNYNYGILNNYSISSPHIEVGDLGKFTSLDNYYLEAGLSFSLTHDLKAKVGYKKSKDSISSTKFSAIPIKVNGSTLTDLTNIDRSTEGLFFGVETRF